MKRNDIKALHEKTVDELNAQLLELKEKLAHTRLERGAGKASLTKVRSLADDVARVYTVLREKELTAVVQPNSAADAE